MLQVVWLKRDLRWEALTQALVVAFEASAREVAQGQMLGFAAVHPLAPHFERRGLHVVAHQGSDFVLSKSKLSEDRVKSGAILPCHGDDPVDFGIV
jgi:aminoglycoside phosphotransferase family enzyme